jgi:hypothetical protein
MSNESDLQSKPKSLVMPMSAKFNAQYSFDTASALSSVATARPIAVMPDQSMPTVQVNSDMIDKLATPNYSYKNSAMKIRPALSKRQHAVGVITDCQNAFSEMMHTICNAAATHRKQETDPAVAMRGLYSPDLPAKIRIILERQMPLTEFGMRWEPGFQVFYGCGNIFVNHDATNTLLTHDLAHIMVGACGNLPWCPKGEPEQVLLAEYNAVFIENIFDKVYNQIVDGTYNRDLALFETINYVRWFVDVHYASHPFPIPAEEAYRRFCWNMDVAAIVRLSPLFFAMKHVERNVPERGDQTWEFHFNTEDAPSPEQVAAICPNGPMT